MPTYMENRKKTLRRANKPPLTTTPIKIKIIMISLLDPPRSSSKRWKSAVGTWSPVGSAGRPARVSSRAYSGGARGPYEHPSGRCPLLTSYLARVQWSVLTRVGTRTVKSDWKHSSCATLYVLVWEDRRRSGAGVKAAGFVSVLLKKTYQVWQHEALLKLFP